MHKLNVRLSRGLQHWLSNDGPAPDWPSGEPELGTFLVPTEMTEEKSIEIKSVHRESEIGGKIKSRQDDDDDDDGEIEYQIH